MPPWTAFEQALETWQQARESGLFFVREAQKSPVLLQNQGVSVTERHSSVTNCYTNFSIRRAARDTVSRKSLIYNESRFQQAVTVLRHAHGVV